MNKREFIKRSRLIAGGILAGGNSFNEITGHTNDHRSAKRRGSPLLLSFKPYDLQLKHVFTISSNSRTSTPVVLTEIEYEGTVGYGEASMPPYLGESHETVQKFLSLVNLEQFKDPFLIEDIIA